MKNAINKPLFKGIRIVINLVLVFLIICIVWTVISFFRIDSEYKDLSEREKPCNEFMSYSSNDFSLVLNNRKLTDCNYFGQIIVKLKKFARVNIFARLIFAFFITLQLWLILKYFPSNIFKSKETIKRIRYIAISILIYVALDFIIRFYPRSVIPSYLFYSTTGLNSLKNGFLYSLGGLNFNLLFISGITFLISLVFKRGNQLQSESDLTI